jgi:hypothetical protein
MRAIAFLALLIELACTSCSSPPKEHTLPPPGPPIPAPPVPAAGPPPPQMVMAPHPSLSRKRFGVIFVRASGNRREVDGESTVRVVNTLGQNGLGARKAPGVPADLPAKLLEAAQAAAEAFTKSGGAAEVFIYGEITSGKEAQVRIAAVDMRTRKVIDNFGNQGPPALLADIIHKTLEETVNSVDAYFRK